MLMFLWVDIIHLTHNFQGYFTGIGAIIWLSLRDWSNPNESGWMNNMDLLVAVIINTSKQNKIKPSVYHMG